MPAFSNVHDFFTRHDNKQCDGFITRLDRSSVRQKKTVFFSALSLNLVTIACLAVLAVLTVQDCLEAPYPPSTRLAFALTQNVLLAAAFLAILRSTIIPFFLGECRLRYLFGFLESEPLIRRAPRCIGLRGLTTGNGDGKCPESNHATLVELHSSAQRLVDPRLLFYRPGSLLSKCYWTPDYPTMLDAYKHLGSGNLHELHFDFAVWKQEGGRWTACQLWRVHGATDEKLDLPGL